MKRLRLAAIALVVGLTLLFNIQRLDFGQENGIQVDPFVYPLSGLAVVATIMIPALGQWPAYLSLSLWLSLYIAAKLLVPETHPLFGGTYSYVSLTEVVLLSGATWLARAFAARLKEFEQAVENLTFSTMSQRVRRLSQAEEQIKTELFRSRRHHRPLTLMVVEPEPITFQLAVSRIVREIQEAMMGRYVLTRLGRALSDHLRRTDLLLEQDKRGRFILLCPETDAAASTEVAARVRSTAEHLGIAVNCGVATFPDEALTFEALLQEAESDLQVRSKLVNLASNGSSHAEAEAHPIRIG
jgi:GGDEF domain-containing protein